MPEKSDTQYPIAEIFYSIQGEGMLTGTGAVFVRVCGCNKECQWCDEPMHKCPPQSVQSPAQLYQHLSTVYPNKPLVVLTGGEPSLYDFIPLIRLLGENGWKVAVETNGYYVENIREADHITFSPKEASDMRWQILAVCAEIKVVLDAGEYPFAHQSSQPYFLQPVAGNNTVKPEALEWCIQLVKQYPSQYRLGLQTHKLIHIP